MRSRNGQPCLYHDLLEEMSASYGSAMEPGPKSEGSLKLQRWALLKHLAESPDYRINFGGAQRFSRFEIGRAKLSPCPCAIAVIDTLLPWKLAGLSSGRDIWEVEVAKARAFFFNSSEV